MRPSHAEVRRRVEVVVAAAARAAAADPAAVWPGEFLAVCLRLQALAASDAPDPAAVDAVGRVVDDRWRAHDAALWFGVGGAVADVRQMHRCRWCGYDCRSSPGRCPECGHAIDEPDPPPALARPALRRATVAAGVACLAAALFAGPPRGADWRHRWAGLALFGTGTMLCVARRRPLA